MPHSLLSPLQRQIVERFHEVYYSAADPTGGGTWMSTYWLGVPVQKCPLDLWIYQEILFEVRPDLIFETGTYQGGSALFLASICELLGTGRVVTIDILPREGCPRHPRIQYLTGSSVSSNILSEVTEMASGAPRVMAILDSDHSKAHVFKELEAYGRLVTPNSYLIVEDTNVNGHPVLKSFGPGPMEAVEEFLEGHPEFSIDRHREKFFMTFNPRGYLRKRAQFGKAPEVDSPECPVPGHEAPARDHWRNPPRPAEKSAAEEPPQAPYDQRSREVGGRREVGQARRSEEGG